MASDSHPGRADARLAALFPEPGSVHADPRRRRRRNAVIACVVVLVLVLAVTAVSAAFGSSGTTYRTAAAGPHQVDSVLTGVATIEPISQATVAFPVAGTVASVNVHVGDAVAAGGVLASLDTQSLGQTLHSKQAALAQAQLTLEKALSGQSVGGVGSSGSSGSSGSFGGSSTGASNGGAATAAATLRGTTRSTAVLAASVSSTAAPGGSSGSPASSLAAAQQAVLAAQQQVDTDLQRANAAVATVGTACAAFLGGTTTTTTPPTTAAPPDATACQAAITAAQGAQQTLAQDQQALADASNALDTLLGQRASTPSATTPATPPTTAPATPGRTSSGTGGPQTGASTGASGASRATGSTGSSPTAADLVAYQASVDAATSAVAAAQQAVDAATMTSPIAGTVVGVNLQTGDSVSASSSTKDIVVQGHGGFEISTSVSVDRLGAVAVGQAATVVPDGSHRALTGKVVSIGVVPASTTTTATLYHVIVGLEHPDAPLHDGATGTVSIVTKQAHAALAVPTSAVTTTGSRHTVSVLRGGSPTAVAVQIGVMGDEWTEITSGLRAGDQVVLADVGAALPGSATASNGTTTGTTNRFGGFGGTGTGGRGGFGGAFPGGGGRG